MVDNGVGEEAVASKPPVRFRVVMYVAACGIIVAMGNRFSTTGSGVARYCGSLISQATINIAPAPSMNALTK
jgi:hypothetical protein